MTRRRTRLIFLAAAAAALAAAGVATAQSPPSDPAIGQYVETLPTSAGGTIVGTATKKGRPLAPRVREKITRGVGKKRAPVLEYVATSTAYGAPSAQTPREKANARATAKRKTPAPATALRKGGRSVGAGATSKLPPKPVFTPRQVEEPGASPEEALASAVTAVPDVTDGRVAALFALLFLISASALTLGAQRRKQRVH